MACDECRGSKLTHHGGATRPCPRCQRQHYPRTGEWQQTFRGVQFYVMDPCAAEVVIEDVAHHLSQLCRFGGATRVPYSVAEHSVRVAAILPPALKLWGLLHDASETYVVDVPRPLKSHLVNYREIEGRVQRVVCDRFGLDPVEPSEVAHADAVLLFTEARDLMGRPPSTWKHRGEPLPEVIVPWTAREAERRFLDLFATLYPGAS